MSRFVNKIQVVVNYLLEFVLDESEALKKVSEIETHEINSWFYENFGRKLKSDLPGFNHLYNYENREIQDLIWQLKFNDNYFVAEIFGKCLAAKIYKILKRQSQSQKSYLVPIPIHKKRRLERGYNQCEWLCEEIIKYTKDRSVSGRLIYSPDILKRKKYTQKQSWHTDRKDRLEALKGVYEINKNYLTNINEMNLILIDDVYTSGTTINEARRLLLAAGANSVLIFTIAH